MKQAQYQKRAIEDYYEGYYNCSNLINHLVDNRIDTCERSTIPHSGYTVSGDKTLAVFFYGDGSLLMVGLMGMEASK